MKNKILFQNKKTIDKREYTRPEISVIKLDYEISLVMMSIGPSSDPFEAKQTEGFSGNPFKF